MEPIKIKLRERLSLPRTGEPLRFGVPLPGGIISDVSDLALQSAEGNTLPAQFSSLAKWPDESIRWACIETQISPQAQPGSPLELFVVKDSGDHSRPAADISSEDHALKIAFEDNIIVLDQTAPAWKVCAGNGTLLSEHALHLEDNGSTRCTASMDGSWSVISNGAVSCCVASSGWWLDASGTRLVRFNCQVTLYPDGLCLVDNTIHNPKRARHPGGLWDLGDPGSIHFTAMFLETTGQPIRGVDLSLAPGTPTKQLPPDSLVVLHQESSGGEHWSSRNHVNAQGQTLPRYRGYRLRQGENTLESGDRAAPVMQAELANGKFVTTSMPHFWQNFPSALEIGRNSHKAFLFPAYAPEPYELQGGERKTLRIVLGLGKTLSDLQWTHSPLVPVLSAEHYERTAAFQWFRADQTTTALDNLIQEGLEGASNFFAKREVIDEFGWRNFGDLFADHETLYQEPGETPFNTHYNNQYDGIYGFARQFAYSGDTRWFELMDDLARHVVDIDIYHTDEDRAEYNNGLFWHTDHYLDAHTCTHRTFTRHNNSSSTPGQLGGGPAAEHCYTTGHLYHYWLTGNPASRDAVLKLTNWMETLHQGQRGLLAEVLALKKQELPKLRAMLRGDQVSPHRFPFTRGTGNYITALLDAHLLEPSNGWLTRAESVIRQTIHPADDIEKRDLLDTEIGWSYLILLASIARYLHIKEEIGARDSQWRYARDSFLHYTEWMLNHERPFLSDTSELEFANDTWTAQDVRKAMLMFQAAQEDPHKAPDYQAKAREWLDYVTTALQTSPERSLTRLQIILLQNYGPQHLEVPDKEQRHAEQSRSSTTYQAPLLGWGSLVGQIVARLMKGLLHFRPRREKAWLEARLDR
ncbi:hypothetical protein ACFOZ5_05505 [Marinobacter lacisalsi]|uniref:PcRGLX/YetA-like N-terminal RIFT barrel domain-containing protein n=1 Tax=Marinobacter lacisalsi TaxID=475979 RepID=A0ABV8QDQ7_9GAMM